MPNPQNIDIQWRYSPAIFDPNMWHEVSEARVDWLFRTPLANNLHSLDDANSTLEIKGVRPQRWQFLPVDGVVGRYVLRSDYAGPDRQVGACLRPDEVHPAKTGICLLPSSGEDGQKWDVDFVDTTGSTWIFRNVDNGTDFVLDCHPGNPIFMNDNFAPDRSPAQHWIVRADAKIDNPSFSTTYTNLPAGATNKPLPTPDEVDSGSEVPGATTPDNNTPQDNDSSSPVSSGTTASLPSAQRQLSAGAVAGIGIGAALVVLFLGIACFLVWLRRRKRRENRPNGHLPSKTTGALAAAAAAATATAAAAAAAGATDDMARGSDGSGTPPTVQHDHSNLNMNPYWETKAEVDSSSAAAGYATNGFGLHTTPGVTAANNNSNNNNSGNPNVVDLYANNQRRGTWHGTLSASAGTLVSTGGGTNMQTTYEADDGTPRHELDSMPASSESMANRSYTYRSFGG